MNPIDSLIENQEKFNLTIIDNTAKDDSISINFKEPVIVELEKSDFFNIESVKCNVYDYDLMLFIDDEQAGYISNIDDILAIYTWNIGKEDTILYIKEAEKE